MFVLDDKVIESSFKYSTNIVLLPVGFFRGRSRYMYIWQMKHVKELLQISFYSMLLKDDSRLRNPPSGTFLGGFGEGGGAEF